MGDLLVQPYNPAQVEPASYDCLLDRVDDCRSQTMAYPKLTPYSASFIDDKSLRYSDYTFKETYILEPGTRYNACTIERVTLPADIAARVEGKSSLGRLGLFIHITAGWIDPGFRGIITLELFNASNSIIYLERYRKICQLAFMQLDKPANPSYNGKYQNSTGVVHSLDHLDNPPPRKS